MPVTFDHSTFISNTADDDGGAVHAEYSSVVIASSTFINNAAADLYHDFGTGGAVNTESSNLTIEKSTFIKKNIPNSVGGTVFAWDNTATIYNSKFIKNTAAVNGGAVGAWSSTVTVDNSNYIANTADFGGALYKYTEIRNLAEDV